ncbi:MULTISPECIES: glycoside hydrolase family 25 protein [Flavobacterium]|uniref:Glycoside hydrolase family 25 protein n=1 Tax=Flavobacterium jumunjinense TaxID=998845 RepID=A0ABV5GT56_9FLAO|nr:MULTISPECIES: GH25 family lysozyme [Flavobacterium]
MLKNLTLALALWFLIDWAYTEKIKPFLISEITPTAPSKSKDSTDTSKTKKIKKKDFRFILKDTVTYGLDISHYQGDLINALNKKEDSLYFVICKATEGISFIDPNFVSNWTILKDKKVVRGAYHFYHCDLDPKQQAQHFASVIMDNHFLDVGQLPPVLDIENSGMDGNCGDLETAQKNVLTFLEEVKRLTERIPMIYTNKSTGNKYLNNKEFTAYPLWVAAYTTELTPSSIPTAWNNEWTIWQQSESYSFQDANFDFDIFNGNRLELRKFIRSTIVKK